MSEFSCAQCRYNLTGLPVPGRCPECGTDYDAYSRVWSARRPWRGIMPLALTLGAIIVAVVQDGTDPEELLHLALFLAVVTAGIVVMYRKYFNHDTAAIGISASYVTVRQALDESRISWEDIKAIEPGRFRSIKIERNTGDPVWIQWAFGRSDERDDCVNVLRSKLDEFWQEMDGETEETPSDVDDA